LILLKSKSVTAGLRHKKYIYTFAKNIKIPKWVYINKKRKAGKSHKGLLLYSRRSPFLKKFYNIINSPIYNNQYGVLIKIMFFFRNKPIVGLIKFSNGAYCCNNIPHGLLPGGVIKATHLPMIFSNQFNIGDTILLEWLENQNAFFRLIGFEKKNGLFACAAGTFCTVVSNEADKGFSKIRLPSGLLKYAYNFSYVTLGRNSNISVKHTVIGNAGDNIVRGFRPSVRGVAMNPVDHPHGGRTKTNSPELTPWGKIAKKNK